MLNSPVIVTFLRTGAIVFALGAGGAAMYFNQAEESPTKHATPMVAHQPSVPANPAIDIDGFLRTANLAAGHRETRRLSEEGFLRRSSEPGVIVLDARSREMFDRLHIRGAVNLPFPDIAVDSLKALIPDTSTTILIYCNNNFAGRPVEFASKMPAASLNLSTYSALYGYGYRNIYELGPLLDADTTVLELVSSEEEAAAQ